VISPILTQTLSQGEAMYLFATVTTIKYRDVALAHIEDMVLSFLTQLSESLPPTRSAGEIEEDSTKLLTAKSFRHKKITMQLADRRKIGPNGCHRISGIAFLSLTTHAQYFPYAVNMLSEEIQRSKCQTHWLVHICWFSDKLIAPRSKLNY
jgi:hypothetical protein